MELRSKGGEPAAVVVAVEEVVEARLRLVGKEAPCVEWEDVGADVVVEIWLSTLVVLLVLVVLLPGAATEVDEGEGRGN